jgi:hypothetical protein
MIRKLVALTLGLVLCAAVAVGAGEDKTKPGKATVELTSLSVSRQLADKAIGYSSNSVSLSFAVRCPGKYILALDPTETKVSEFKDDKGTILNKGNAFFTPNFSQGIFAKDRSGLSVYLNSFSQTTARGATKLIVKGNLVLVCGVKEKSTKEVEVEMKDKAKAKIGDFDLEVNRAKGFSGGPDFTITSASPTLKGIKIVDADGKEQPEIGAQNFYSTFLKKWSANFSLNKPLAKAKITLTYFDKTEKVTIPVDREVGVGL